MGTPVKYSVEHALQQLPGPAGERFVELLRHGSMRTELYAPRGHDPQQPHAQDELYFIQRGSGEFVQGEARHHFAAGDAFLYLRDSTTALRIFLTTLQHG